MRDLRKYWQDVHTMARVLPEFVWMTGESGELVEVSAELAAKLLIAKSHRLATEEEIRAKQESDAAARRKKAAEVRRKRGVDVVAVQ